jgi:uncharacterized protein YdiU (UPF0061 family)
MPVSRDYLPQPAILELGPGFFDEVEAASFPKQILRFRNQKWAERTGLGALSDAEWKEHFALFSPLPNNLRKPLALRYHGHQFRSYNPQLGDGRGFLFAQMKDVADHRLLDLGTKGSGKTPYSRTADGRLTLKGAVREALATEMLEALGVNTSKTLSIFETGEELERHDEPSPTRAAVLVRLSHSHIRFGTFQRLAYFQEVDHLRTLVRYCIRNYFPELVAVSEAEQAQAFFNEVAKRSASLCAEWMIAGFVHGVLNTDNMNVTGESFDYGPYRFLPHFDPEFTAAYFDHEGLYSYGRQPETVLWNLEKLAQSLSLITTAEPLVEVLNTYADHFNREAARKFVLRLGLESRGHQSDEKIFVAGVHGMSAANLDFAQFFHDWYGGVLSLMRVSRSPASKSYEHQAFAEFKELISQFQPSSGVEARLSQDYFERAKPCGLLIDEIDSIWSCVSERDDWSKFEAKIEDIRLMGKSYGR